MPDLMPPLDPGAALGASAAMAARGIFGNAIAKAAANAIAQAQRVQMATFKDTVVADFKTVRQHADLAAAVAKAVDNARALVLDRLTAALEAGYRAGADAQAASLGLVFTWGEEDRATIDAFPVVDHSATEHADQLSAGLAFDVGGAVARVLIGGLPADQLAAKLDTLGLTFSQRVGALVADGWWAGRSAATHAMAAVLTGP